MTTMEQIIRKILREEIEAALDVRSRGAASKPSEAASGGVERPELMTIDAVVRYTGIGRGTLANWRSGGRGPRFLKVGRLVRYKLSDLDAWLVGQHES